MYIKLEFEKGHRDCNKSKQTSNQLKPDKRNTVFPALATVIYNSKPNACTNKAFSNTSTRFNPYSTLIGIKYICKMH